MPDKEFYEKFNHPLLYPNEATSKWKLPPWNRKLHINPSLLGNFASAINKPRQQPYVVGPFLVRTAKQVQAI